MKTRQVRGALSGRDMYRTLTAAAVLIVAGIAAVISFEHISRLALVYGQPALAAYLMPLSVDGLVTVSSLAMLRAARAGFSSPVLARSGLVFGILATLGANVASGLPHGPVGSIVAGWPAVAFVISAEIAITMVRRKPARLPAPEPVTRREVVNPGSPGRLARQAEQDSLALMAISANPGITFAGLAAELGTSERTARRVRARVDSRLPSVNGKVAA